MPWNFKAVYFEAVGYCNAKCAYCHSGVSRPERAKFLDVDVFRKVLTRLLAEQVVQNRQVISLYNWGEPVLHPKLGELAGVVNELGLKYAFSTNASRVPKIDRAFVQSLDHVIFSMPGFSQEAYDRIHGFRFPEILKNIDRIVNECREHGFKGRFSISYHVYKFNTGEMRPCEKFADKRDVHFNPYYAILNNWWEINDYVTGRLPEEKRQIAKRDLFTLDEIERVMAEAPKTGFRCPQNDLLNIDENGTVVTCCQIGKGDPGYGNGQALTDNLQDAIQKKMTNAVCNGCIGSGLAYFLNTSLQRPEFYKPSMRQRLIRARSVYRRAVDEGFWPVAIKAVQKRVATRKVTTSPAPSSV